jgi:hypothetical protein
MLVLLHDFLLMICFIFTQDSSLPAAYLPGRPTT